MATILFGAVGAALGSGIGSTVLGLSGAVVGRAVGATVGRMVDQRIIGLGSDAVEVGRLDRFHIMGASEGAPIAKCWGRMRLAGQVIWASPFVENRRKTGGKGTPSPSTVQYSYSTSLAIALCEGKILGVGRIWADGEEIASKRINFRVYTGTEDQLPDLAIEAELGQGRAPAYRGIAYVLIENLDLSVFGNRVPQFSFEVMRQAQGTEAEKMSDLQKVVRAVSLIPGTGEYSLATKKQHEEQSFGAVRTLNVNSPSGQVDILTSINQLKQELPNCRATSLVVSWFGNDLRCGHCTIEPKVEQKNYNSMEMPWQVSSVARKNASEISRIGERSIFGGTPADSAVVQAINALKEKDLEVMFYPFILMDIMNENLLPDPYSDEGNQPILPWRGRITLSAAPGRILSADTTSDAEAEVKSFFGSAQIGDFALLGDQVIYSGPTDWKYRRFILHYAFLCKLAGGVESFCIGSEMRGLTQIRGPDNSFPAVLELIELSKDVRAILGPDTKIGYAADWTEYFGYHVDNNVYFNLDLLWASSEIDFVGIDNYMPISDWRSREDQVDADWRSIYNINYLKSNINGGEGFDWFYESQEGYENQLRKPIVDGAYGEDWIFKCKDIKSWWSNYHHDRMDDARSTIPTTWIPKSKPIRFTEYGCPAIDRGTNEPSKFLDEHSSESMAPRGSTLVRDDFIQTQFFRAHGEFWNIEQHNPPSDKYSGQMLDWDHCYAWAWDTRPFPDFPRNTDVWSDGLNYYRGHWINGRSTNIPLDQVVSEICQDCGLSDIETDRLYGSVHGYAALDTQSGRSKIQSLSTVHGFDCVESEGKLIFCSRGVNKLSVISNEKIVVDSEFSTKIELTRLSDRTAVERVRFTYLNSEGRFSVEVAEASDIRTSNAFTLESEYMMAMPNENANSVVVRWLSESQYSREQVNFHLPYSEIALRPGDEVKIDEISYRVDSSEIGECIAVSAVRTDRNLYDSVPIFSGVKQWRGSADSSYLSRFWLDLPLIASDRNPTDPYIAVTSHSWKGPAIVWSSDEDSGYEIAAIVDSRVQMGRTLSDLPRCQPGVIDRGPSCRLVLNFGEFSSTNMTGFLNGRNLVAIGDGSIENWELMQFGESVLVSPGVYDISHRLRGRFGSEQNIPEIWPAGSYIVVIDSNLQQVPLKTEAMGSSRHYRISSQGDSLGDESVIHDVLPFRAIGLRPFTIVHPKFELCSGETHCFNWFRRTRFGGDSWEGFDVPLSEEKELYSITICSSDGVLVKSYVTEISLFEYTRFQRSLDGVGNSYVMEIAQISIVFGAGPKVRFLVSGLSAVIIA